MANDRSKGTSRTACTLVLLAGLCTLGVPTITPRASACATAFERGARPPRVSGEEARVGYAAPITDAQSLLQGVVPDASRFAQSWLTTFEEQSATRGRADLSFSRARAASRVEASIAW